MSKNEEEEIIFIIVFNDLISQQQTYIESQNNLEQQKFITFEEKSKNEKIIKLNKKSTISSIKIFISDINNVSGEKIHLFIKYNNNNNKQRDNKNNSNIIIMQRLTIFEFDKRKKLMEELKDDTESIGKYLDILDYNNIKDNNPCFYFIISNNDIENNIQHYSISVIIDFYQQNIDKIFLTLLSNCSIFLLKKYY